MNPVNSPRFPRVRVGLALICAFAMSGVTTRAGKNDAVVISSTAAADYVRPTDEKGKPVPQSYVFMEGKYLGGGTVDNSEARMTFDEITRILATNLAKQNYLPTKDVASASLLIRIFWGTTLIYEDPQRDQNIAAINTAMSNMQTATAEGGVADPGELKMALGESEGGSMGGVEGAIARNAALLGYKRTLDKEGRRMVASVEEQTMRMELAEERYFVVLMAYDYQFMKREKKPKLAWVTRLSIRGPGNNFTEALPALALAGAEVYGRNLDSLERIKVRDLPGGEVILGELKVLGAVEKKPDEPAQKTDK
jgi:hypothetical protein